MARTIKLTLELTEPEFRNITVMGAYAIKNWQLDGEGVLKVGDKVKIHISPPSSITGGSFDLYINNWRNTQWKINNSNNHIPPFLDSNTKRVCHISGSLGTDTDFGLINVDTQNGSPILTGNCTFTVILDKKFTWVMDPQIKINPTP